MTIGDPISKVTLLPAEQDYQPSKELLELHDRILHETSKVNELIDRFEAGERDLKNTHVHELTDQQIKSGPIRKEQRIKIMRAKAALLRWILDAWFPMRKRERVAAHARAEEALEKARADIKAKLMALGYHDPDDDKTRESVCRVMPGMIHGHPSVFKARMLVDQLWAYQDNHSDQQLMERELIGLSEKLSEAITRFAAGV